MSSSVSGRALRPRNVVELIEDGSRLEIVSPVRTGLRWLLALVSLFPLIAPYELLVQIRWHSYDLGLVRGVSGSA